MEKQRGANGTISNSFRKQSSNVKVQNVEYGKIQYRCGKL
jgi:hypothetical protein